MDMDQLKQNVEEMVRSLKETARRNEGVPLGPPPEECRRFLPDGLGLCLTVDFIPGRGRYWHLSVARTGDRFPSAEEIEFWRRAFFDEEPLIEVPGMLNDVNSRHFFWDAAEERKTDEGYQD
jgi:hypothetical protein